MRVSYILAAALAATSMAPAAMAVEKEPSSGDKVVCKNVKMTGTRLGRERVCMTKAQWEKDADEARKNGGDAINNMPPGPKG